MESAIILANDIVSIDHSFIDPITSSETELDVLFDMPLDEIKKSVILECQW